MSRVYRPLSSSSSSSLTPCACSDLFCQPWIRFVYLLRTPSSCLLRGCCCRFMLFPSAAPRLLPPAPAGPPREPQPGLLEPLLPPGFLAAEFPRSAEEELVLLVPGCGLQSVLSILSTGRRRAVVGGGGGRAGRRRGRGWTRSSSSSSREGFSTA